MDALFGICTAMLKSEKHYSQVVEFGIVSSNRVTLLEKLQVFEGKIIIGTKIICSSRTCGVSHFIKVDEKLEFCMSTYSKGTTKGIMHLL